MSFAQPIRSQTRNLVRILRSASFRLPLIYAVLFVLSAGALFVTVYWTATAAMQDDMAAVLRTEAYQLAEIHRRSGLAGLAEQITRRINFRTRGPIFYLLQAPNRRVVVGNLPGMPPVDGVVDFVPQTDTPEPEAPPSRLTGFGITLSDGSFLLVAQDTDRLIEMQHAIARAFVWASGLTLLLADRRRGADRHELPAPHRYDHAHQPRHHGGRPVGAHPGARHPRRDRPARVEPQRHAEPHPAADGRTAPGLERHRPRPAHAARPPAPAPRGCARTGDQHRRLRCRDRRRHRGGRRASGDLLRPAAHRPGRGRRAEARLRRGRPVGAGARASARPTSRPPRTPTTRSTAGSRTAFT